MPPKRRRSPPTPILGDGFDLEVSASNDSGPPAARLGREAATTGRKLTMGAGDAVTSEMLAALGDGVLIFDHDGRLSAANADFRDTNPGLAAFLAPGIPWDLLLLEGERQAGFPRELCARLRQIEASVLDGIDIAGPVEAT